MDDELLDWLLPHTGVPHHRLAALGPDFLVISPPKTGSTWLADNLRCHPQLFVPPTKEIRYFSSFFKSFDLGWYLDQFVAGAGRMKGEASPSYAALPVSRVRLVRRLFPGVKLVFLMRDPIARAWSHARHAHLYQEGNFASCTSAMVDVSEAQWQGNCLLDWNLTSGDYLGQLRRWLAVFPREQVFIGFYESIAERPHALLRELFGFLGVEPNIDLDAFPVRERIMAGPPGELSAGLRQFLHGVLHRRSVALAGFLRERLGLEPPPAWRASLEPPGIVPCPPDPPAFRCALDDDYVAGVVAQEERFPSARCEVAADYRGYGIAYFQGVFAAQARELGPCRPEDLREPELQRWRAAGQLFLATSLPEVKECVDRHQTGLAHAQLHERIAALEHRLDNALDALQRVEACAQQRPLYRRAGRLLRDAWRRARAALQPG
jgi:hypothetical protein